MPRSCFYLLIGILSASCGGEEHLLRRLNNEEIGVDYVNLIVEDDTMNPLKFEYIYNGGGVGVGDFDNNGLPDLYFSGNRVSGELFLQLSPWNFARVTEAAGLNTTAWCAGVNVHDVDGNGYEDIYLATLSPTQRASPNLLFLNQGPNEAGIPEFEEAGRAYGLDHPGYGTHSAWLDLENDGDLDLFVVNNSLEVVSRKQLNGTDTTGTARSMDAIYVNLADSTGRATFKRQNRLKEEGWGLGVIPSDFNNDGATDLYVANDFWSVDHYFINDGSGNLSTQTQVAFAHTSRNSMGVDAADLNNDGRPEIMTVDMMPNTNLRRKTMFGDLPFGIDRRAYLAGYGRQYVRNALQYNNGDGSFSDIGWQTGTAATDWSWTPLLADFNNDGYKDIFISNGYPKDVTNRDFIDFSQANSMFGTDEVITQNVREALEKAGGVHQPNSIFRNGPDLSFAETNWIEDKPTYSNGAIYVDLDADGDLDLVTNNLNEPAGIYRNYIREKHPEISHFLQLELRGPSRNPDGLGCKVYLWTNDGQLQYVEQQRQRGYLGTVDATLHFGLGEASSVDSLLVLWPNRRMQRLRRVEANQRLLINHTDALNELTEPLLPTQRVTNLAIAPLADAPVHTESAYTDFDNSALAVRDRSHDGPALAVGGDAGGGRFLVVGGAAGQSTTVYDYVGDRLVLRQALTSTTPSEAVALALFDADGDGDEDLYVGNGSSEFGGDPAAYLDQYFENADGRFVPAVDLMPSIRSVTSSIAVGDLEGDGDPDLFIGTRNKVNEYPRSGGSHILRNDGGHFTLAESHDLGMVTAATWVAGPESTNDRLVVLAEYQRPTIGQLQDGKMQFRTLPGVGSGWWYSISAGDLDGDGDQDLLLGNVGLNSAYRATPDQPLTLRVADYDDNGTLDPLMLQYSGKDTHPVHPRNTLGRQLPGFKRQMTTYARYGGWTDENMPPLSASGFELSATEFRNIYLRNDGADYTPYPLSNLGQTAPIRGATLITDQSGQRRFLAVQNDYAIEVLGGRLDAGTGLSITADSAGRPLVDPEYWSVRTDARSVARLGNSVIVGSNDGPVLRYLMQ